MRPSFSQAAPIATRVPTAPALRVVGYDHASVAGRSLAFVADVFILSVLVFAGALALAMVAGPSITFDPASTAPGSRISIDDGLALLNVLTGVVISVSYFALGWAKLRGSPGQRLLGMEIRDVKTGSPVGIGQAASRWALLGAPLWIAWVVAPGLAGFTALFLMSVWSVVLLVTTARNAAKQGLHDRYSRTVVIRPARRALTFEHGLGKESRDVR